MNSSHRKRKQTASAVDDDDGLGVEEPVSKQARVGEQPEALSTPAPRAAPAPAPAPAPVPATAPAPAPKPSKPWQRDPQKPDAVKLLIAQKAAAAAGLSLAPLGAPVQQAPAPRIPRDGAGSVVRAPVSGPPFAGILAQSLCLAYKFQPTLHSATVRKYPGIPLADNNQPVVIIPTGSSLSNKLCGLIPGVKKSKKDVEKRPNPDKALATTSYSVRFEGDIRYKPPNADGEVDQAIFLVVGSLGANYTAGKEINMGANIEVHAQFYAQESISVVQCVCILFCFDENGERVEFGYKTVKGEFIQGYHIMEVWSLSKTRDEVYTTPLWQGIMKGGKFIPKNNGTCTFVLFVGPVPSRNEAPEAAATRQATREKKRTTQLFDAVPKTKISRPLAQGSSVPEDGEGQGDGEGEGSGNESDDVPDISSRATIHQAEEVHGLGAASSSSSAPPSAEPDSKHVRTTVPDWHEGIPDDFQVTVIEPTPAVLDEETGEERKAATPGFVITKKMFFDPKMQFMAIELVRAEIRSSGFDRKDTQGFRRVIDDRKGTKSHETIAVRPKMSSADEIALRRLLDAFGDVGAQFLQRNFSDEEYVMLNQHMHSIFTSTRYSSRDQAHIAFTWQNLLEGNSKLVLEGADDRDRRIAELEDDVNDRDDRIADLKAENSMLRAQAQIPAPLSAASPTSPFRGAMHSALQKQQRGAPSSSSSSAPVAGISRSGGTPGLFDSTPFGPFTSPLLPGWVLPPGMLSPYLNDGSTPTLGSLATTPMQGVQMQEQEQEEQRQGASFSSFASLAAAGAGAPSDPEAPPAKRPSPSKPVEAPSPAPAPGATPKQKPKPKPKK